MARAKGQRSFPPHGTQAAYRQHLKYGPMPPCEECREANRQRREQARNQMIVCVDCGRLKKHGARNRCDWCYEKLRLSLPKKKRKVTVDVAVQARTDLLDGSDAVSDSGQTQPDVPGPP